jgi:hypothetical protein
VSRAVRAVLLVLSVLAALYALGVVWRQNERAAGLDFYIYFAAGQLAGRADVTNIYSAEVQERVGEEYFARAQQSGSELRKYDAGRRRRLDLVSSPFLYSTLRWVSRDYDRALTQIHIFILCAFIGGVLLLSRASRVPWCVSLALIAALLLWYRGFEADLRVGNVNSMQLFAVGLFVWIRARLGDRFRGAEWVILGALLLFKPNVMFVPLFFAISRLSRREMRPLVRDLVWGAAGAAIAFVTAAFTYGSARVWLDWVHAANAFYHRLPTRMERNVTPPLPLLHAYGEWVSYALALLAVVIVCIAIWRSKSDDAPLLAGLGLLVYLLTANVVWLHYMVLVLPIAIALLRHRWTAVIALLALAAVAEEPFEWITHSPAFPIESLLITTSLVALVVCGVWMVGKARRLMP